MHSTLTGTFLTDGVEYNESPAPGLLIKAMSRLHANQLIDSGKLRIRHLEYFRNWENKILGDANDGNSQYLVDGHPMETSSMNDVYAWCLSSPKISDSRLTLFAEQGEYDCKVAIHDPAEMFQRIKEWLVQNYPKLWVHCGVIKYDRGQSVDKNTLNSKKHHYNVFQKAVSFHEDQEYRLSITNLSSETLHDECLPPEKKFIDLEIGNCNDIASIEVLPIKLNNSIEYS